jgi:hypothetical protein
MNSTLFKQIANPKTVTTISFPEILSAYAVRQTVISNTNRDIESLLWLLKRWFLAQRLQNYGYDAKSFRQLSAKACHLRKLFRHIHFSNTIYLKHVSNYGLLSRLMFTYGKDYCWHVEYITGQSFNEEYIDLLEIFTHN